MTHQLAPTSVARTPAASVGRRAPRAKLFQQSQQQLCSPTPRSGLALLSNNNTAPAPAQALQVQQHQPATVAKAVAKSDAPERGPPSASAYEAPFEWEFLPDTMDWLRLLRRFGCPGGGYAGFGDSDSDGDGECLNNKENVPPTPSSPTSGCRHWEESPTNRRRRGQDDCVEICFDIDRIL